MKIKLSEKQWKQVITALDASEDTNLSAKAKPSERVIGKITRSLKHGSVVKPVAPRGWLGAAIAFEMDFFGADIELSTNDVEIIINALNDSVETKRDEIDDEVVAIDANDTNEPINDIKEHLSDALEKANEVESLEAIRKKIEAQQDEQKENEKDNKIAELRAKVDTQQMAIKGKDGEIASLKNEARSLCNQIQLAERHIYDLRRELDYNHMHFHPRFR